MGSPEAEGSIPPSWEAAIKELGQVRKSVAKLASLLQLDTPAILLPETAMAGLIVEEIFRTINATSSILESGNKMECHQVDSPSSCVTSNKQSPVGKRNTQAAKKAEYRRRGNPYSCTKVTSDIIDDGHTWRKYGQKEIFNAKHPRSYYRCTHKFDRGCKASRQVQLSEDDSSLYVITYFGEHTCSNAAKTLPPSGNPRVIREMNTHVDVKQETQSPLPSLRQDGEEEVLSNISSIDSPGYFAVPEMELKTEAIDEHYNDSLSCSHSSFPTYGMEFMDIDDLLSLDQTEMFQI